MIEHAGRRCLYCQGDTEMENSQKSLIADLRTISVEDRDKFLRAVAAEPVVGRSYFFPYLQLFSQLSERERVLHETVEDSIAVYRQTNRRGKSALSLLLPPFPWNEKLLIRGLERTAAYNRDGRGRVSRISEDALARVARLGLEVRFNMDEYIYDQGQVAAATGSAYAMLRRKLSQTQRIEGLTARDYTPADEAACLDLLSRWSKEMAQQGVKIGPYRRYARLCLKNARAFGDLLRSEVIEIKEKLAAFTFGGAIDHSTGCVFVTVSDKNFPGIAYLQRYNLITAFPDLAYFNDGPDSDRPGMAQMKRTFRPVRMHAVYSARTSRGWSYSETL